MKSILINIVEKHETINELARRAADEAPLTVMRWGGPSTHARHNARIARAERLEKLLQAVSDKKADPSFFDNFVATTKSGRLGMAGEAVSTAALTRNIGQGNWLYARYGSNSRYRIMQEGAIQSTYEDYGYSFANSDYALLIPGTSIKNIAIRQSYEDEAGTLPFVVTAAVKWQLMPDDDPRQHILILPFDQRLIRLALIALG